MKIDYENKARVLRSGLPRIVKEIEGSRYADFALHAYGQLVPHKYDIATAENMRSLFYSDDYREAEKINHAEFERANRLRSRVLNILSSGDAIFLTLTFSDKTLSSTSSETRRRYVSRFLRSSGLSYVANVDFGKKNGREHYHAVISSSNVNFSLWHDKGAIKAERIHAIPKDGIRYAPDIARLSKYVAKLSNHAIKQTTKRSVLLYSRD